jgi:hypothetical protein
LGTVAASRTEIADQLDNIQAMQKGIVSLTDDEPQAVGIVVHYLYHLDYPSIPMLVEDKIDSNGNGRQYESDAHWQINGHNGQMPDGPVTEVGYGPKEDSASVETIDELRLTGLSKKDKKRKKKKGSAKIVTEELLIEPKDLSFEEAEIYEEAPAEEVVALPESLTTTHIVTHAKIYALSKKYGIEGLKALALEKFEDEIQHSWSGNEFLQAAKVVYTSTVDDDDKEIRNTVASTLYQHPELLDRKETQQIMKGSDLGFDLLMRVRSRGGFGDGIGC